MGNMPLQRLSDAALGRPTPSASSTAKPRGPEALLLPSEMAARTLGPVADTAPWPATQRKGDDGPEGPVKVYKWIEFAGKEQVTEFDASHFQLEGHFESNSSEGHKEYQDRLRTVHFRKEGRSKAEIASILGRSEKFVAKWWNKDEREIPRPWGVHEYLTKELAQRTATNGATATEDTVKSTATWWRDIEVRRSYVSDPAIYEELLNNTEWRSSPARTRDFSTGASHLKYDKEGKMKVQGNQSARYVRGTSPAFEKLLQKFFSEYGIADRTSGIGLNWYPDGESILGSHRHDCWTALFSFGDERILTMDKTPLLLQDSDLVIFGTQRHGVPRMPEITGGRITVPIFFYPDHLQMQKQWQTLTDPEDPRRSRELAKLQYNHDFTSSALAKSSWDESGQAALQQLQLLGFEEGASRAALQAANFDLDDAAEMLLMAGATQGGLDSSCCDGVDFPVAEAPDQEPLQGWEEAQEEEPLDDEALALKLQLEKEEEDEDVDAVLAAQLEEEDFAMPGGGLEPFRAELLAQQFQEYEERFQRDEAEEWHGHGDLMMSGLARSTLTLESMDKVTCYSIGHGQRTEPDFFELLQLNSIRVLYDLRPADHRGEVHASRPHFAVRALKQSCKVRGITYRHIALGRETAYGILKHISSDEAQHALVELAWHAKRARTAFLGAEEDWRMDRRQVIAEELHKAGHTVKHIDPTGAPEDHEAGRKWPDFLVQEEDRLRKLEKMRQAGELKRPEKSAADRSTEAIASKLSRPAEVVDTMDELRAAQNQVELVRAQKKLARIQRLGDKHGILANKVLEGAPEWILEEARQQEAWIAKKKMEKAEAAQSDAKPTEKAPPPSDTAPSKSAAPPEEEAEELRVECLGCGVAQPWRSLAAGDGRCSTCRGGAPSTSYMEHVEGDEEALAAETFLVECATCGAEMPWRVLRLADGICPGCVSASQEPQAAQGAASSSSGSHEPAHSVAAAAAAPANRWARRQAAAAAAACG